MILVLCSAALVPMSAALAAGEGLDEKSLAIWERHWRSYAKQCAEFEGGFLVCPLYNKRYPSSAGMTVRQAEAALSKKVRIGGGGVLVTKTLKKPVEEAQAMAIPIPKIRAGEYGSLSSVQVKEVLGPESMLVQDLYLIEPDRVRQAYRADRKKVRLTGDTESADGQLEARYEHRQAVLARHKDKRHRSVKLRLEGFKTDGLMEGDRWSGPDGGGIWIVIAKAELYGSKRRLRQRWVAVSVDQVAWGLNEDVFVNLLRERGLDPEGLVGLILKQMAAQDPKTARGHVFHAILTGKPPGPTGSDAEAGGGGDKEEL